MKQKKQRSNAAVNSRLIRRPIQRCFAIFLLPTFVAVSYTHLDVYKRQDLSKFLMVAALAAIGLNTDFREMQKAGLRPMLHGFILSALVVVALLVEMAMGLV